MGQLKDKVAVITGGSSGIGQAIAKRFNQEGASLTIFGRSKERLKETTDALKNSIYYQGDVTKTSDLDALYQTTAAQFGKIDILVACAGIGEAKHVEEVDEKFFDEIVNVNYKGVYFTVQRALPYLNENASIILISSVAGHIGWPSHSVYCSTKAAVSHLAKTLSSDLISRGIRVNAISPGFIDTPMFDKLKANAPERIEQITQLIPSRRFARGEEIAEAACFLSSPLSSYVVGADIVIDGGLKAIFPAS